MFYGVSFKGHVKFIIAHFGLQFMMLAATRIDNCGGTALPINLAVDAIEVERNL